MNKNRNTCFFKFEYSFSQRIFCYNIFIKFQCGRKLNKFNLYLKFLRYFYSRPTISFHLYTICCTTLIYTKDKLSFCLHKKVHKQSSHVTKLLIVTDRILSLVKVCHSRDRIFTWFLRLLIFKKIYSEPCWPFYKLG